jgi:hypothetical protein
VPCSVDKCRLSWPRTARAVTLGVRSASYVRVQGTQTHTHCSATACSAIEHMFVTLRALAHRRSCFLTRHCPVSSSTAVPGRELPTCGARDSGPTSGWRLVLFWGGVTQSVRHVGHCLNYCYQCWVTYECGAFGRMTIGRGNLSTQRKPAPVLLCPQQIQYNIRSNPGPRGRKRSTALRECKGSC